MTIYYELLVLGLVCFLAPYLAKLAGFEVGRKSFDLVGIGGVFFFLTAAFSLGQHILPVMLAVFNVLMIAAYVLGWVTLLIGALWSMIGVWREPDIAHHKV